MEHLVKCVEASWAVGKDGRLTFRLSYPHGVMYMINVDDGKPQEIANIMKEEYGIRVVPYFRQRARNDFFTLLNIIYCCCFNNKV